MNKQCVYLLLCPLLTLISCVSQKKYDTLLTAKDAIQKEYSLLRNARFERNSIADSLFKTTTALTTALQESDDWKGRYQTYVQTNEQLNKELDNLRQQNQALTDATTTSNDSMRQEISDRMKELDARERDLKRIEGSLQTKEGTIEGLKKVLSENELKIKELSDALKAKDVQMSKIQQTISDVLKGFAANELTVRQENGKVYVALSEALLFAKGKSDVGARGNEALRKLATALNASPDVEIGVEGHTDSDGSADLNWQLSTARAVNVAKILVAAKVEPKRIVASGRSLYHPLVANDSDVNKAKNRRTEIILSPRLDELYNLIKNK
jgi:chemotaxis protein MotB